MDLVLNQNVQINNAELKKITGEIRKAGANVIGNTYKIAALIAHVHQTEIYLEDGFVDTFDYVKQCFGLEKASAYNLIKVGSDFIEEVEKGNTKAFETALTHGEKDYSISQVFKMLPLGIDKAKELTAEGVIDETMSCRQIDKIVKENTDGNKSRGVSKTEEEAEEAEAPADDEKPTIMIKWDDLPDDFKLWFMENYEFEEFKDEIKEITIH